MRPKLFIALCAATQLCILLLHMNKHFMLIKYSFILQKEEKLHKELIARKEELAQQLCNAQNLSSIKEYARKELGMQPLKVHQIKRVECS